MTPPPACRPMLTKADLPPEPPERGVADSPLSGPRVGRDRTRMGPVESSTPCGQFLLSAGGYRR